MTEKLLYKELTTNVLDVKHAAKEYGRNSQQYKEAVNRWVDTGIRLREFYVEEITK